MIRQLGRAVVWAVALLGILARQALPADSTVVVILDDSGSMKQPMPSGMLRIDAAKQALTAVLSQLPPDTRVGVLALNTKLKGDHWVVPMGKIGQADWRGRVASIKAEGGTMLGEFSKAGADELLKLRAADRYGTYRLLVVTDGEASDPAVLSGYLPDILSRGLTLDVIGVNMASQHSLAKLAHSYRSADDAESLTAAISEVFAETTGDDQSSQADFELLAGLPDGVSEEIIKSLMVVNNEPIEAVALAPDQGGERFQLPVQPNQSTGSRMLGGLVCCIGSLFCLAVLGVILLRAVFGQRRRN
jgi:von Willebrand factor type A domain